VSVDELYGSSAQLLAACCLPGFVKRALPQVVIECMYRIRNRIRRRLLSRGLPRNCVFEQPLEHRQASASISIVVPIHDAPLVTKRCLASLERDAPKSEIILLDDGSRIAETTHLIREFSSRNGWKVIRNADARGHSAACLEGARAATRPYLCLLNSDTVVTPWCWQAIKEAFEMNTAIGVAGPCTSTSGNEQALDTSMPCRFYWNDSQICAFAERLTASPPQPVIVDLPWVSGFAFFIRRRLWEKLGGFDHNLPDYGNEIELCKRVMNCGYRAVWVRSSYIHHLGQQSYSDTIGNQSRVLAAYQYIRKKHSWQSTAGLDKHNRADS
jgi:GT2 family glycosyltransferase